GVLGGAGGLLRFPAAETVVGDHPDPSGERAEPGMEVVVRTSAAARDEQKRQTVAFLLDPDPLPEDLHQPARRMRRRVRSPVRCRGEEQRGEQERNHGASVQMSAYPPSTLRTVPVT